MVLNKRIISIFIVFYILTACDGTLGGFDTIKFFTSKNELNEAINNLYVNHSEYKVPNELEKFNNWKKSGYDFLEAYTFYFDKNPKEFYYVSFVGDDETFRDTTHVDIAIRSVFIIDKKKWLKEEDFNEEEKIRIQKRFKDEIISKLEEYTKTKSEDLNE
ncbi:hypothetical protein [Flavobacterium chilense]|uniref:Uncharacterized protein n=1 Tax=Flavobacterium chilense TaxID=946677 RepID=A0A1M7ITD2_9FLAO|nr:hypothetical protein [Flavobacterium chilense]SHM44062.1 hypothetical protein SAMN05444484_10642 [Flavobacterium chilense]